MARVFYCNYFLLYDTGTVLVVICCCATTTVVEAEGDPQTFNASRSDLDGGQ